MRKSDKKIESCLVGALKAACEIALGECEGFKWLTHLANYTCFPQSLSVVCVFDTNDNLTMLYQKDGGDRLRSIIRNELERVGIPIQSIEKQVRFDTEEDCYRENDGKWSNRFT